MVAVAKLCKPASNACRFDYFRTVRLATYGGLIAGPLGHYWFGFLDAKVFPRAPKR